MPKSVQHAKLESRSARSRFKRGRQGHFQSLAPNIHVGYQIWKGDPAGRWLLRRYLGGGNRYTIMTIGTADDALPADGRDVLDYEQARAKALAMIATPGRGKRHRLSIRQALQNYTEFKNSTGKKVDGRGAVHILPVLGDMIVSELEPQHLRKWLSDLAHSAAQTRPKKNKPQYQTAPKTDEDKRRRQSSANRVLTILKAALNYAYAEGHVNDCAAWGKRLAPFAGVEEARIRYLTVAEARRLINACDIDFRALVHAALETGCRYGELTRLEVQDFNPDAGTLIIRKSKSGKARHVILTHQGAAFFQQHCSGRAGSELMFVHADGTGWKPSEQARPMDAANAHARLKPPITFHGLRHSWASLAVMGDVPLMVIAKNLGHTDTRMVEKFYGHLAPSFISDTIRAGGPKYNIPQDKTVRSMRAK